jgi:hypothetical protein
MNEQELQLIKYALCFLNANWDEDNEDDLDGVATNEDVQKLAEKYCNLLEEHRCYKK